MIVTIVGGVCWILLAVYWASGAWSTGLSFWFAMASEQWPEISEDAIAGGVCLAVTEGCQATIAPAVATNDL